MTAVNQPTLREQVEDFLFKEAALLDEWRLDDWVDLFTEDGRYVVPTTDLPETIYTATQPKGGAERGRGGDNISVGHSVFRGAGV